MACFFIVDTYIDKNKGRGSYDVYIEQVKPIVESYGGEYLVRTENVTALSPLRKPDRVKSYDSRHGKSWMPAMLRMNTGGSCMSVRTVWMQGL